MLINCESVTADKESKVLPKPEMIPDYLRASWNF